MFILQGVQTLNDRFRRLKNLVLTHGIYSGWLIYTEVSTWICSRTAKIVIKHVGWTIDRLAVIELVTLTRARVCRRCRRNKGKEMIFLLDTNCSRLVLLLALVPAGSIIIKSIGMSERERLFRWFERERTIFVNWKEHAFVSLCFDSRKLFSRQTCETNVCLTRCVSRLATTLKLTFVALIYYRRKTMVDWRGTARWAFVYFSMLIKREKQRSLTSSLWHYQVLSVDGDDNFLSRFTMTDRCARRVRQMNDWIHVSINQREVKDSNASLAHAYFRHADQRSSMEQQMERNRTNGTLGLIRRTVKTRNASFSFRSFLHICMQQTYFLFRTPRWLITSIQWQSSHSTIVYLFRPRFQSEIFWSSSFQIHLRGSIWDRNQSARKMAADA